MGRGSIFYWAGASPLNQHQHFGRKPALNITASTIYCAAPEAPTRTAVESVAAVAQGPLMSGEHEGFEGEQQRLHPQQQGMHEAEPIDCMKRQSSD